MRSPNTYLPWGDPELHIIRSFAEKINKKDLSVREAHKQLQKMLKHRSYTSVRNKLYKELHKEVVVYKTCITCNKKLSSKYGLSLRFMLMGDPPVGSKFISVINIEKLFVCSDKCLAGYLRTEADILDPQYPDYIDLAH